MTMATLTSNEAFTQRLLDILLLYQLTLFFMGSEKPKNTTRLDLTLVML